MEWGKTELSKMKQNEAYLYQLGLMSRRSVFHKPKWLAIWLTLAIPECPNRRSENIFNVCLYCNCFSIIPFPNHNRFLSSCTQYTSQYNNRIYFFKSWHNTMFRPLLIHCMCYMHHPLYTCKPNIAFICPNHCLQSFTVQCQYATHIQALFVFLQHQNTASYMQNEDDNLLWQKQRVG